MLTETKASIVVLIWIIINLCFLFNFNLASGYLAIVNFGFLLSSIFLLDDGNEKAKDALLIAVQHICVGVEPGFIGEVFSEWIDQYCELIDKSNQNNCYPLQDQEDSEDTEE